MNGMVNLARSAVLNGETDLTVSTPVIEKFREGAWEAGLHPCRRKRDK